MPRPTIAYQYIKRTPIQSPCQLNLTVEETDCLVAAKSMIERINQPVCVLNMANSIHVGGDYLTSKGQEEELIKRTDLLQSLLQLEGVQSGTITNPYKYQLPNCLGFSQESRVGFGEFTCLYSSEVIVKKLHDSKHLGIQEFKINVISSAAYNLAYSDGPMGRREFYIAGTIFKILNQLRTAKLHGQRHLVLGAFGCGAFHNDPRLIAELYNSIINEFEFQGSFDTICFAIKPASNGQENHNYLLFKQEFTRPSKILSEFLSEVVPLRNTNSTLHDMLIPFDTIDSNQELLFLATKLIATEIVKLSSSSQRNEYKIHFYTRLSQLLKNRPENIREILASALLSPTCDAFTPTFGIFKGAKPYLITKLDNLLSRAKVIIPGFIPKQSELADAAVKKYILPRVKEFMACCEAEEDKRVSCYILYLTATKNTDELKEELSGRYIGLSEVHALLIAMNELCLGQSKHDIYFSIADNCFFSGSEEIEIWKNRIARELGRYVALRLLAFLEVSYPNYFDQEFFEVIFKQNCQEMFYHNDDDLSYSPCNEVRLRA